MSRWQIPITIVEYGRLAIVEADTKAAALRIFRTQGWDEMTDASRFKVTKVGPCMFVDDETHEGGTRGR